MLAGSLVSLQLQLTDAAQPAEQPRSHLALVRNSVQLLHNIPTWDNGLGLAATFVMRPCCRYAAKHNLFTYCCLEVLPLEASTQPPAARAEQREKCEDAPSCHGSMLLDTASKACYNV